MLGSVTCHSRRSAPAPSISAASWRCFGTSRIAARKITIALPIPQRLSKVSDGLDQCGESNHSGPLIPIFDSSVFTGPVDGLNRNTNPSVAATVGASVGR